LASPARPSISWPIANGLSDPSAEIDFFGGVRWSHGSVELRCRRDLLLLPEGNPFQSDFWEVYMIAKYAVSDQLTVGGSINYSPNYLKYGIDGTAGALNFAWTVPTSYADLSFYTSGELGYVWLGSRYLVRRHLRARLRSLEPGLRLDLEEHHSRSPLSRHGFVWYRLPRHLEHGSRSNSTTGWCGDTYVAKLSFAGSTAD
jgi:hypothetical protein